MTEGIYKALRGAVANERALEVVADNVANASTSGFQARKVVFEEYLSQAGGSGHRGVRMDRSAIDGTPGAIRATGRRLDVAIDGPGYLVFEGPSGHRLGRNGALAIDAEGRVVGTHGWPVLGRDGAPIIIAEGDESISVGPDGEVTGAAGTIGHLWLSEPDPASLMIEGEMMRLQDGVSPDVSEQVRIVPNALEGSNANAIQGMLDLIRVSRTFESLTRAIEIENELATRTARQG